MEALDDTEKSSREIPADEYDVSTSAKQLSCLICLKDFQIRTDFQTTCGRIRGRNEEETCNEDKRNAMESFCGVLRIPAVEFVENLINAAICDDCNARILSISEILASISKLESELKSLKRKVEIDLDRISVASDTPLNDDSCSLYQLQLRDRIRLRRKQDGTTETAEVTNAFSSSKADSNAVKEEKSLKDSFEKSDRQASIPICDLEDEGPLNRTRQRRYPIRQDDSVNTSKSNEGNADESPETTPKKRSKRKALKRPKIKSKLQRKSEEARRKDEEKKYKCKVKDCATLLDCYEEWTKHLTVCHNMFVCNYLQSPSKIHCNKIYDTEDARDNHLKRYHLKLNMRNKYQCEECPSSFPTIGKLEDHVKKHKGINDVDCKNCGQAFRNEFDLLKHRRKLHGDPYPFVCEVCNKGFNYKNHLKIHNAQHGEKQIECEYCHQRFYARGSLKLHYISHHSESKKYICQVCGKDFPLQGTLNRHQLVHSTERLYRCSTCGKAFKSSKDLHKHSVLHSELKSYLCHLCGAAFRRKDYADIHLKTHESGRKRPFFPRERKQNPTTKTDLQVSDNGSVPASDERMDEVQDSRINTEVHTYYLHASVPMDTSEAYE